MIKGLARAQTGAEWGGAGSFFAIAPRADIVEAFA